MTWLRWLTRLVGGRRSVGSRRSHSVRPMLTARDRFNRARDRVVRALYQATGGRVGAKVGKARILLLTTTGRSTGQPHTVPLIYVEQGDAFVVTASNAGQDHEPSWCRNLRANPDAAVEIGDRRVEVRARFAEGAERDAQWPRFVSIFRGYAAYQRRTSRTIPVVFLEAR